jgi:hypothetical protein
MEWGSRRVEPAAVLSAFWRTTAQPQRARRDAEEGEMKRFPINPGQWSRSAMTGYLELTALTLAVFVILVSAERVL